MCVVFIEALCGLRVITSAVGVKMTAPPVMTMFLVTNDGTTASITLGSSTIISVAATAATLGATTARLRRVVPSTASTVVGAGLLLAVLLVRIISFVLVLVLGDLLILKVHHPITLEVVAELVRIQRVVWIKRMDFLIVCQATLHVSGENLPKKL